MKSKKSAAGGRISKPKRAKLGPGERRLERALLDLGVALDSLGAPWMIIGGLAVIAKGVRRTTTDIDAAVRGDAVDIDQLAETLAVHGIEPRASDARAFARKNLVYLARHAETGVDLDISLAWSGFEHEALDARSRSRFGAAEVPMARAEDLVVFKVVAGRAKDLSDAAALLSIATDIDIERVRRRTGELAALAELPEIAVELERLLERVKR